MKNALAILLATSFMASQVSAQTLSAPVAPVIVTDDCDDPATSEVETCPVGLIGGGLGDAGGVALIGGAAIIGIILFAASTDGDSTVSTPGTR